MTREPKFTIKDGILIECDANGCGSVRIPDEVTSIGDPMTQLRKSFGSPWAPSDLATLSVFVNARDLSEIDLPDSVTDIAMYAFAGCRGLVKVSMPGVQRICMHAFEDCRSLEIAVLPDGLERIDAAAFAGCSSLRQAVMPDSVTKVGSSAFAGCGNLEKVRLSENLASLEDPVTGNAGAFAGCDGLKRVVVLREREDDPCWDPPVPDECVVEQAVRPRGGYASRISASERVA